MDGEEVDVEIGNNGRGTRRQGRGFVVNKRGKCRPGEKGDKDEKEEVVKVEEKGMDVEERRMNSFYS